MFLLITILLSFRTNFADGATKCPRGFILIMVHVDDKRHHQT